MKGLTYYLETRHDKGYSGMVMFGNWACVCRGTGRILCDLSRRTLKRGWIGLW